MSTNGKREFWILNTPSCEMVSKEPIENNDGLHVIEYQAYADTLARLNGAEAEVKLAKRTLAEYEHECETINEMKTQLTLAEALIKELETALEGCPCTEMFRPILAHTKYCEKCAILAKLAEYRKGKG